jgi:hypothetical protein
LLRIHSFTSDETCSFQFDPDTSSPIEKGKISKTIKKKAQISKPKIKTKPLFYIKHNTNSGHVPPKEVQTLPLNLRKLIPKVL